MNGRYPWKVASFKVNSSGRDFVAGDLHGEFRSLEFALDQVEFNFEADRLFCVGDLIDRGPQSPRVVEFLQYNWFYSIAGNHEWMLYNCHVDKKLSKSLWFPNGGDWWKKVARNIGYNIIDLIETQLFALITIQTPHRKVGLIHALAYPYYSWAEFCQKIEREPIIQQWALWERDYEVFSNIIIEDIDLIICGHTPMKQPFYFSNFVNIDTGAGHSSSHWLPEPALTIVELSEPLKFHRFPVKR